MTDKAETRPELAAPPDASDDAGGGKASSDKAGIGGADSAVEPWKQYALSLLIGYLILHLAALTLLTFYPLLFSLRPEGFMGQAYLDLLTMEIQKVGLWFIVPFTGVISVASLWRAEMLSKRRWLLRLAIAGVITSLLFYVLLIWMRLGINLWQYEGPPDRAEFKALAANFAGKNLAVFAAALFGAVGAQIPNWFGART